MNQTIFLFTFTLLLLSSLTNSADTACINDNCIGKVVNCVNDAQSPNCVTVIQQCSKKNIPSNDYVQWMFCAGPSHNALANDYLSCCQMNKCPVVPIEQPKLTVYSTLLSDLKIGKIGKIHLNLNVQKDQQTQ